MKHELTLVFAMIVATSVFSQTGWAAEGTRWWYNTRDFGAYNMTFEYESTGQAMVGGQLCQVIQRGNFSYYTYESNGQVYLWENEDSVFSLRYSVAEGHGTALLVVKGPDGRTVWQANLAAGQGQAVWDFGALPRASISTACCWTGRP